MGQRWAGGQVGDGGERWRWGGATEAMGDGDTGGRDRPDGA